MITLTIAIPTFNRRDLVVDRVSEIRKLISQFESVDLLVIDNNSPDGTYEALDSRYGNEEKICLFRNEENINFHGNFLRLIEEARKEFLLVSSDEDEVTAEGLEKLLVFLNETSPSFVSTQFWIDRGKGSYLYRGSRKKEEIHSKEFHATSFYLSGIVFSVSLAKKYLQNLKSRADTCMGVYYYPHTLLAAHMIAEGRAYLAPFEVCKEISNFSPNVKTPTGSDYNVLTARWEQFKGIYDYLVMAEVASECDVLGSKLRELRIVHGNRIIDWLRWGVVIERPDLRDLFDSSVQFCQSSLHYEQSPIDFPVNGQAPTEDDVARASLSSLTTWRLTKR